MRVKRGIVRRRRHKKIKALTKGYRGMRSTTFVMANQAMLKAGQHAYRDRRRKKRDFRALWNIRLSAALKPLGTNYSRFINAMKKKEVLLNRKVLSELAIHHPDVFAQVVKVVS